MTYLTTADALLLFPNDAEYGSDVKAKALTLSYSMVNSFLDPVITVPALDKDGSAPGILQIHQAKFYQWILESANHGWSEELQNLYDSTRDALKMITEQDIFVSELQVSAHEIGWILQDNDLTSGKVFIYDITGYEPSLEITYKFVVTTEGYAGSVVLTYYGPNSATALGTITDLDGDYVQVGDTFLYIRLSGEFIQDEEFDIKGVPQPEIVASNKPQLQQSILLY